MGTTRKVVARRKDGKMLNVRLSLTEQDDSVGHYFTGILTPLKEANDTDNPIDEDIKNLRGVLKDLLVAAIVIDSKGNVLIFNRSAEKLLGYREKEVLGKNVKMLMPSPDKEKHDHYIARYIKHRKGRVIGIGRDVVAQHKSGKLLPVFLSVTEKASASRTPLFTGTLQKSRNK
eukprot:TRINITY_DN6021_c0_g1_i2.p1 TRINITY_DN6021_c0_g1~~TRINITY_DN6021_c0_g1_i2.p1  ORF type:complete len:174 (-),score=28.37 TRINITY_DN6021_c0_g1_i2:84-605(-)